jgi:hypothetical protein
MHKTYKKSDINKYTSGLKKEKMVNELINADGTLIDRNDNFKANQRIIRSKKTTDDFIRGATQGPEAYFIYGGPYYGINYSYTVSEGEEILEEKTIPTVDESQIDEMKNLVDEIIRKKKDEKGLVKKAYEQDIMGDVRASIPDISELKQVHEKPMVTRKMDLLLDLIHKEGLNGDELAIVLNHIVDNVDVNRLNDEYREIIGDKIKYGEENGE